MRNASFVLVLIGAVAGCNSSPSTRAVTGQLSVDTSSLSHPVVIAQSSDHRVFVADVTASRRFTLQLPTNVSYRMTLASASKTPGIYSEVARINWPLASGAARWATLGNGATIDLGAVFQRGSKPSGSVGINCDSCGGGGHDGGGDDDDHGDCHEDDHAGCQSHGSDGDCDCGHTVGDNDHCDKDDDADQHDKDCDDDDHHKCSHDGGDDEGDHGGDGEGGGHQCDGGTHGGGGSGGGGGGGAGGGGGGTTGSGGVN